MRRMHLTLVLVLATSLTGGFLLSMAQEAETTPPTTGEITELRPEVPRDIPDSAKAVKNPISRSEAALESGERLFTSQCSVCHAKNGEGVKNLPAGLSDNIPDFTRAAWQTKRTDGELFYIITEGHGRMRGQKDRLREEYKWNMIHHMRTLKQ